MDQRVQIFALALVLAIVLSYLCNRRLPLRSTKWFSLFLFFAVLNLVSELTTHYTLSHVDTIPGWLNRVCHQVFIGSIVGALFSFSCYIEVKANVQKRIARHQMIGRFIPILLSGGVLLFGDLEYYIGKDGRYSYGTMADLVYVAVACYLVMIIYVLIKTKEQFTKEAKTSIFTGLFLWAAIAIYQLLNPTALISSVAVSLMVLFIYLSLENPREYFDAETKTLNRQAFHLMLAEMVERKRKFYLINFQIEDIETLQLALGHVGLPKVLGSAASKLKTLHRGEIFHSRSNMISIMVSSKKAYKKILPKLESCDFLCGEELEDFFLPKYFISILECPKYAKNVDDILYILDYLQRDDTLHSEKDHILMIDDKVIEKKNYRLAVEQLIQKAIEEDGFEVYYQPIYSTKDKKFSSAEALVRLRDKETLGYISPEIFIPIAEERGFIRELGNMVFEKVCKFAKERKIWLHGIQYIEINLSAVQGIDASLFDVLKGYLERYDIRPEFINLEITETASVGSGEMLQKNMKKLREYGCSFSMDDFGTGYSNLSQVAKIHYEIIKLDKSLIWPCFEDDSEDAKVVLNNCIRMIKKLGIDIVAEGVETEEQAHELTEKGVDYLQGYYFSRPIPEIEFYALLTDKQG